MTSTREPAAPAITVIIPHLNTPDSLARCLESVLAQILPSGAFELIVVDNGSRQPLAPLAVRYETVRFLVETAPGPGLARNTGAAAASSDCLAFIDADCVACPGWLAAAHAAASAGQIAGGDIAIEIADPARMTGIEAFETIFGFRQRKYISKDRFSVTANLAMPRSVLDVVGPFGGIEIAEDVDWGQRAHAMGLTMTFRPDMKVLHPPRQDMEALQRKFDRIIGHHWHEHVAGGRPVWRWQARALAMALSPAVDGLRLLVSPKISGVGNRLRGLATLVSIRWYRCRRMLAVASAAGSIAVVWNS